MTIDLSHMTPDEQVDWVHENMPELFKDTADEPEGSGELLTQSSTPTNTLEEWLDNYLGQNYVVDSDGNTIFTSELAGHLNALIETDKAIAVQEAEKEGWNGCANYIALQYFRLSAKDFEETMDNTRKEALQSQESKAS